MPIDKELIQDVIDRMIKFEEQYNSQLRELNSKFEIDYKIVDSIRTYGKEKPKGDGSDRQSDLGDADCSSS